MTNKKMLLIGGIVIITAIIIGAGVYMTKRLTQVLEAPKPEFPQEISPAPEIDTSDWKTYRNEEYGYEIKYPADWYLLEEAIAFDFCKAGDENCLQSISIQNVEESLIGYGSPEETRDIKCFEISIFRTDASSLEEWIYQSDHSDIEKQEMLNSINLMKIGVAEKKVWRRDLKDIMDIMFLHKGKRYSIRYTSYDVQKDWDIVKNILSTLQFLK